MYYGISLDKFLTSEQAFEVEPLVDKHSIFRWTLGLRGTLIAHHACCFAGLERCLVGGLNFDPVEGFFALAADHLLT